MIYKDVFSELNKRKIKYLVIGGVATNLHGFLRTTLDLDIAIALDAKNKKALFLIMKKLKFKTIKSKLAEKLMLSDYIRKDIKVVTFFRDEFELVDVFIQNQFDFGKVYKRKKIFKSDGLKVPTVPLDVLIDLKEKTGRERDLIDVGYLKQINEKKDR